MLPTLCADEGVGLQGGGPAGVQCLKPLGHLTESFF